MKWQKKILCQNKMGKKIFFSKSFGNQVIVNFYLYHKKLCFLKLRNSFTKHRVIDNQGIPII